jgi:murein DD-endopeptidase MepM/ murein hydrolase activator NlpD
MGLVHMGNANGAPRKTFRNRVLIIILIVVLVPVLVLSIKRLEGRQPQLTLDAVAPAVGETAAIRGAVADADSGIRRIWVGLVQNGKEAVVFERDFPGTGIWQGGDVNTFPFDITLRPKELGFGDGEALLRVAVWDHSWRGGLKGNHAYLEKTVVIDTKPPKISVLTRIHNVAQGGAGVLRYRLSEECPVSGVTVGEQFYPGAKTAAGDMLAYFAVSHDQPTSVALSVTATDAAGNTSSAGFPHHIRRTRFKKDTIRLSDRFLGWKMPEFFPSQTASGGDAMLAQFLTVNRDVRARNYGQIVAVTQQSDDRKHWQGAFLRMPGATRATFGERRMYTYKGKEVDRQVHLGTDLASLAQAPIPAANDGRVVFADALGIYGNTVIIDHGFGLFSLYSHLSSFATSVGESVAKGATIGRTGTSGLAGGDHLHFSVLVHQTFVNPLEWWDAAWIANNVTTKLGDLVN